MFSAESNRDNLLLSGGEASPQDHWIQKEKSQ
jgi:hypothetical protein